MSEQIGWFDYPDMQDARKRLYVKKSAHLRKALLKYFNEGDMLHPLKFKTPVPEIRTKWGAVGTFSVVTTPKVRHAVYLHRNGMKMIIFANSTSETVKLTPHFELNGKLLAICREGDAKAEISSKVPELELKPRSFHVLLIGSGEELVKEADRISETMLKIAAFRP